MASYNFVYTLHGTPPNDLTLSITSPSTMLADWETHFAVTLKSKYAFKIGPRYLYSLHFDGLMHIAIQAVQNVL
jgi:hypothetical protein